MWTALRRGRTCWAGNPRSMTSILSCLSCCWCSCSLWLNSFISKGGATYELHNTRLFQCFLHVQVLRQVLLRACGHSARTASSFLVYKEDFRQVQQQDGA